MDRVLGSGHPRGRLPCPSAPATPARLPQGPPASRQPAFAAGHQAGIRPVIRQPTVGGPDARARCRFPAAAFRPPALASWASCSRSGMRLSIRPACRRRISRRRTRTGFPRSPRIRYGRVGRPLSPGGDGVPTTGGTPNGRRLPPHNGQPLPPRSNSPTRDVKLTRCQQGFTVIRPSGLPLACNTRSERTSLGFASSFAPSRYRPRTSRWGQVWNTDLKSRPRHHAEPPIDELTHNVRPRVATRASAGGRTQTRLARVS